MFWINIIHFLRNGRHSEFCGQFGFYINYYKYETFLIPNKTFVDIYIGLLQEIVLCRCYTDFINQIAAILEYASSEFPISRPTRTFLERGCVRSFHERQKQTESEMKGLILIRLTSLQASQDFSRILKNGKESKMD